MGSTSVLVLWAALGASTISGFFLLANSLLTQRRDDLRERERAERDHRRELEQMEREDQRERERAERQSRDKLFDDRRQAYARFLGCAARAIREDATADSEIALDEAEEAIYLLADEDTGRAAFDLAAAARRANVAQFAAARATFFRAAKASLGRAPDLLHSEHARPL